MKDIRIILSLISAMMIAGVNAASTIYVSKTGNDDTGDGSSDKPYLTIQKGVDKASNGDTVMVGEGDYTDAGYQDSATVDSYKFTWDVNVSIDKQITLKGAGRGKTFITGAYGNGTAQDGSAYGWTGPNGNDGCGVGARKCIRVGTTSGTVKICDLTIRKGASVRARTSVNNDVDNGGGVYSFKDTSKANVYLYDCDILDCRAADGGAISRGNVLPCRCRFAGNAAKCGNHVAYRISYALNCLFENNGYNNSGRLFSTVQDYYLINCTFINNSITVACALNNDIKCALYNCLTLDNAPFKSVNNARTNKVGEVWYNFVNCVQANSAGGMNEYKDYGCAYGVNRALQYMSPAEDNWNSTTGNSIVGKGNVAYVTTAAVGFPAADFATDYLGNPRTQNGKVSVGCFEPTNVLDLAGSFLLSGGAKVTKGDKTISGEHADGRWFGVSGIGQVRVGYTGEGELFGYQVKNSGIIPEYTAARFPDNNADKGFWLTPNVGGIMTITAYPATEVKWVGPDAESTRDGSENSPYATIMDAIDNIEARGVIKVKAGTYDQGSVTLSSANYRINISKDVAIRSTEGAEKTILKGGSGIKAIILSSTNSRYAQVQGFTLTGCANDPSQDANQGETGMALSCNVGSSVSDSARNCSEGMHLTDSIISNNCSSTRVCVGGWLERCLMVDNFTTVANMNKGTSGDRGTHSFGSILSGCVSYYTASYYKAGSRPTVCTCAHQSCTELNCTFSIPTVDASERAYRTINLPNGSTVAINNAMVNPQLDSYAPSSILYAAGNVTSPGYNGVCFKAVPDGQYFADRTNYNFSVLAGSVGLDYSAVTTNLYIRYETGDYNGRPLAYETNGGKPIAGAFQDVVKAVAVICDSKYATATPNGTVYLTDGEEVTVQLSAGGRTTLGWNVDGTFYEGFGSLSYTYTADHAKSALTLQPIFPTNFYVNANAANDDGDGLSADTAKRKLSSIAALANASGDVIHAAAGNYKEGQMTQTVMICSNSEASYSPSRVVLEAGVTLVADEGQNKTFITGVQPKGVNGVRCVAAKAGALVKGFTLRLGSTSDRTGGEYDENMGGCALAPKATSKAATAVFEDCIITNGRARTGGCVAGGYLHRCKIYGGDGGAGASQSQYSQLDQCLVLGNGNSGVREHYGIRSSTIINTGNGNTFYELSPIGTEVCENSIIALKNIDGSITGQKYHRNMKNCIWNVGGNVVKIDDATCCNVITCTVNLTSWDTALTSLGLDGEGKVLATSPAIDMGDKSLLSSVTDAEHDLCCSQRIYNAKLDIGAYEYDWRADYREVLRYYRLSVAEASENVEKAENTLKIPSGEKIKIGIENSVGVMSIFTIPEGGELTIMDKDDNTLATLGTSDKSYEITNQSEVTLAYTGDGTATLKPFMSNVGLTIIVK